MCKLVLYQEGLLRQELQLISALVLSAHQGVEAEVGGIVVSMGVFVLAGVFVFVTTFVDVGVNISVDVVVVEVAVAGTTLITTVSKVPKYCPCAFCNFQFPV